MTDRAPHHATPPRHPALPIGLVTTGRRLLIVGGGIDAVPRSRHAVQFNWLAIRVLLPEPLPAIAAVAATDPRMDVAVRRPDEEDIRWADVVVKDSGPHGSSDEVAAWCKRHGKLLNCVDRPEHCDLYYMSLLFRGPLAVGITSGGHAPALSSALRRHLETELGSGWATAACLMAELRQRLPSGHARVDLLRKLGRNPDLLACILQDDTAGLRKIFDDAIAGLGT